METVGVIGAAGDLGSQVAKLFEDAGNQVLRADIADGFLNNNDVLACAFVHICAPVQLVDLAVIARSNATIVLHDSVMQTSDTFAKRFLSGNHVAVVHLLMNKTKSTIVAQEYLLDGATRRHLEGAGLRLEVLSVRDHDLLMSKSQAPLALLCQVLLPFLFEQQNKGLLTESGELLAETLRKRQLAWTPQTVNSILANPQLEDLIKEMSQIVQKVRYNKDND